MAHLRVTPAFVFSIFCDFFFFKCCPLPASVSEFTCRCFLRSRCSMEMWCADDIGLDSWDWFPEWGGGSSPVKTEPLQIGLLLLSLSFSDTD